MDLDFLKTRHHLLWFSLRKTTALIFAKASPTKTTLARSCNFNTMAKAKAKAKANAFAIYVPPPLAAFVFLEAMESLSMIWLFIIWKIDNLVGNKNLGHVRDFYGINIVYCFGPDQWR